MTCCGMFQILCSFFGANLVYRYMWPTRDGYGHDYFTLFCGLAMFVIMGIGADDVFVYWDTWVASKKGGYGSTAARLSHVYGHAVNAMLVTSATTVISFFSNLSSSFIGVQTFGLFAGLLVTVNFISVCTFFPAAVLFYEKYLAETKFCFGIFDGIPKLVGKMCKKSEKTETVINGEDNGQVEGSNLNEQEGEEGEGGGNWFGDVYAPFLEAHRILILAVFALVWAVFLVGACLITPTPLELYTLFPPGNNFYSFTKLGEVPLYDRLAPPLVASLLASPLASLLA